MQYSIKIYINLFWGMVQLLKINVLKKVAEFITKGRWKLHPVSLGGMVTGLVLADIEQYSSPLT